MKKTLIAFGALCLSAFCFAENWVSELGNCWESADSNYQKYNEIADALRSGKPGLGEFSDEEEIKNGWAAIVADFERYWSENCPEKFSFSRIGKYSVQKDGDTKVYRYTASVYSTYSLKYCEIRQIVQTGLRRARIFTWNDVSPNYTLSFDIRDRSGKTSLSSGKNPVGRTVSFNDVDEEKSKAIDELISSGNVNFVPTELSILVSGEKETSKNLNLSNIRFENPYRKIRPESNKIYEADAKILVNDMMVQVSGDGKVGSFEMAKTEVTQQLYRDVMGTNPSGFKGLNRPAETMSWYDALYFCNRLSEICGKTPVYKVDGSSDIDDWNYVPDSGDVIAGEVSFEGGANGYRLPTEEEWLFAAQGGSNHEEFKYSGKEEIEEIGWCKQNSMGTRAVASKGENSLGLFDMTGNVWEWCFDDATEINEPFGTKVARGGAWNYDLRHCKISDIYYRNPKMKFDCLGIRLVSGSSGSQPRLVSNQKTEEKTDLN